MPDRPDQGDASPERPSASPPAPGPRLRDVTRLLQAPAAAPASSAQLLELVYDQLRRIAQQRMSEERSDHTLQATALVHEAYARLVGDAPAIEWSGRAHFFAAAGEAMRRILVEHARARARKKRGGDEEGKPLRKISLNVVDLAASDDEQEILSVDEAFRRLEDMDADLARVVRLRFFAGLSEMETAQALGVSDRTVRRDWVLARAWLRRHLEQASAGE